VIWPGNENPKLGKGAALVKRDLRWLPLTDSEFEADFWLDTVISSKRRERWIGAVFDKEFGGLLAMENVQFPPPTANGLATILFNAMSRPLNEGDRQRPHTIYLRDRPQWRELLPHLRELGIEVVVGEELPMFNEAVLEWAQREHPAVELPSKDKIIKNLNRPFPKRKRTWHDDVMDFMKWTDEMLKAAYPSRSVPVPSYDPMTVAPIQLTADELEAILTQTDIGRTKKIRPRLEAMAGTENTLDLSVHEWGTICLALCGTRAKEVRVQKYLFMIGGKIAEGLSEALDIDGPPRGRNK
jgi:hypothetical protein